MTTNNKQERRDQPAPAAGSADATLPTPRTDAKRRYILESEIADYDEADVITEHARQLERELAAAQAKIERLERENEAAMCAVRGLERENEKLEQDKARPDWLEKADWSKNYGEDVLYCIVQQRHFAGENYASLRAAIDAARAARKEGQP